MTFASIVVPAYNVQKTLAETLISLLAQTHQAFEIVLVNDGSTDGTLDIARQFATDPRLRIITQANRGLAGARNTGIAAARGEVIGFCDSDDLWDPRKLAAHVAHLAANPHVGVSYSGSALIDDDSNSLGQAQRPRLADVDAAHVFARNPIGNGSAPVIRRAVFDEIAYRPAHETGRDWYFDETFRQSEDIECWMRIALNTGWAFAGVPGLLTLYRINNGGLSAATDKQLQSWERMVAKLATGHPGFVATHAPRARAYQYRYLARRAISDLDTARALQLSRAWIAESRAPLIEEPAKSVVTLAAAGMLSLFGGGVLGGAIVAWSRLARREARS